MKKYIKVLSLFAGFCASAFGASGYDVAAIVWPAYHPEPRWKELGIFDHGNGEWQNVYQAKPKFEGHIQPLVPLWGYEPENNPIAVARKIDAALAAGINMFVYDWYWYQNRPFLEGALNDGFLKAPNNERMKFYIMWANHDVDNLWNNKIAEKKITPPLFSADVSYDEFTKVLVPRFIGYFKKPNYYKIDGKPVFGLYLLNNFIRGIGSPEKAREALDFFRSEVVKAGFPGLHLQSMTTAHKRIPLTGGKPSPVGEVLQYFGIESTTRYNWEGARNQGYTKWREQNFAKFDENKKAEKLFFPIVSSGWDNNPRYPAEKITGVCSGKDPLEYEKALRMAKSWVDANIPAGKPKLILINAWNEWTEGEHLEPDEHYGYGFLNATARVFGGCGQAR